MDFKSYLKSTFWLGAYLALVLAPLFVLLAGQTPPGRGFWWEFSAALGYAALSMMGVQFALTARFKHATAPFGIDIIYYFHRQVSLLAFIFIVMHLVFLSVASPRYLLSSLDPLTAPWMGRTAQAGMISFGLVLVTSLWRKRLGIQYERWRIWHGLLAVAGVAFTILHIEGSGYYITIPWKRILWTVYALSWIGLLMQVRLIKPWMMLKRPYSVESLRKERGRAWTLILRPEGHRGLRFKPGQFAWLTIGKSPFAIEEHPFSFSSSAVYPETLSFTIKELGDFTSTIRNIAVGEHVYLDGPYGSFGVDRHKAQGYVFIAGGIGIAPVICMLRTLADRADSRPLTLIYATRTLENATFFEELETLKTMLNLNVVHVLEDPLEDWQGEKGYPTVDVLHRCLPIDRRKYHYFICGPDAMMDMVETALYKLDIPMSQFHSERFNIV